MNHADYINSPEWASFKQRYRDSGRMMHCYVCGEDDNNPDFHHLTYARLGYEELDDVVPVCRACHTRIHHIHNQIKTLSVREVTDALRYRLGNILSEMMEEQEKRRKRNGLDNMARLTALMSKKNCTK